MTDYTSLPRTTGALVTEVLDVAAQLGYPALAVPPGEMITAEQHAWGTWAAQADRLALARVLGVLLARLHRRGGA